MDDTLDFGIENAHSAVLLAFPLSSIVASSDCGRTHDAISTNTVPGCVAGPQEIQVDHRMTSFPPGMQPFPTQLDPPGTLKMSEIALSSPHQTRHTSSTCYTHGKYVSICLPYNYWWCYLDISSSNKGFLTTFHHGGDVVVAVTSWILAQPWQTGCQIEAETISDIHAVPD